MKNLGYFYLALLIVFSVVLISCDDEDDDPTPDKYYPNKILIIIAEDVYSSVKGDVDGYVEDLQSIQNSTGIIYKWEDGTVEEMRAVIQNYIESDTIQGVFLIGDLPVAWYEMESTWKEHEEFPFEHYLMDINNTWEDVDHDGKYDGYSDLNLDIFVSRIDGTASEIESYLDKVHDYKTNGSLTNQKALLFIDDDWSSMYYSQLFNVNQVYADYEQVVDLAETTKSKYIEKMSSGFEYVHQMIHSYPATLVIGHEGANQNMTAEEISSANLKGSFYNLFDCSASKFTEECLAMTYVMKTSYGLATMGTTKTGGNYWPQDFNSQLAAGQSWGAAFIYWFNSSTGGDYLEDKWKMGLVILGDPLLTLSDGTKKSLRALNKNFDGKPNAEILEEKMLKTSANTATGTYEDYKQSHTRYFK